LLLRQKSLSPPIASNDFLCHREIFAGIEKRGIGFNLVYKEDPEIFGYTRYDPLRDGLEKSWIVYYK
jgi:hypothetical protein